MAPLQFPQFNELYTLLLDNFNKTKKDETVVLIYSTLMKQDPELTYEQFLYCVQQCLIGCQFMPSLGEMLRQLYEQDLSDAPVLPDIDPRYANEYEMSRYQTAVNQQEKWRSTHNVPNIGLFRGDRLKEIPGIPPLLAATENKPLLRDMIAELLEHRQKNLLRRYNDMVRWGKANEWLAEQSEAARQYVASLPPEKLLPPEPEPEPEALPAPEPPPVPKPVVKAPKPVKKPEPVIVEPDPVPELSPQEKEMQFQENKRKALEGLAKWEREHGQTT